MLPIFPFPPLPFLTRAQAPCFKYVKIMSLLDLQLLQKEYELAIRQYCLKMRSL